MKILNGLLILVALLFVINIEARGGIGGLSGGSSNGKIRDLLQNSVELGKWNTVRELIAESPDHILSGDMVFLGRSTSAFNVCVEGDHFRSLTKVPKIESQYVGIVRDYKDDERDGYADVVVGEEYKRYPLTYNSFVKQCNNQGKRCRLVADVINQSTLRNIKIEEFEKTVGSKNSKRIYKEVISEKYEIKECN